jgi:cytochrome c
MKLNLAIASLSLVAISFTACGGEDKPAEKAEAPAVEREMKAEAPAPAPVEEVVAETAAPVQEMVAEAPAASAKTGAELFAKCVACHGAKAENSALGKSKIIAGWDSAKIQTALNGYKDGSYGGAMKGLMKGQVATLSDADIVTVADYISGL